MSDVPGTIEITITGDEKSGANLDFTTNMSLIEVNFWLDQLKALIVSGDAKAVEE